MQLGRPVIAMARIQCDGSAANAAKNSVPIVFDLMKPVPARRHMVHQRGELGLNPVRLRGFHSARHRGDVLPAQSCALSFALRAGVPKRTCTRHVSGTGAGRVPNLGIFCCDLSQSPSALNAIRLGLDDFGGLAFLCFCISLLNQKPIFLSALFFLPPALHSDERPGAVEFLTIQSKLQHTTTIAFPWITLRTPRATIPDQHGAGPVLFGRNDSL